MDTWMYWKQPTSQTPANGIAVEIASTNTGPWTLVPSTALLEPTDYWCQQRGTNIAGDCYLLKFDVAGASFVRARATSTSGFSDYSTVVALPEPNWGFINAMLIAFLIGFMVMDRIKR